MLACAAETLDDLLAEIRSCRKCADDPAGAPLPHEPRPVLLASSTARICVCGQAPGTRVHASGIPFDDRSGDRLRAWMGVSRDEFYDTEQVAIVPMGFCFPGLDAKGGDRPPRRECAPLWRPRLFAHLTNIRLMLLVGRYAQTWHLGEACPGTLTEAVRAWRQLSRLSSGADCMPLPHPSWRNNAWLRKNPWFETEVLPELRRRVRALLD